MGLPLGLADGAPLAARRLLESSAVETYRAMDAAMEALLSGRVDPVTAASGWEPSGQSLDLLGHWLRGRAVSAAHEQDDQAELMVLTAMDAPLRRARRLVESTARPELVVEELLAKWTEFIECSAKNDQNGGAMHRGGWT